MKHWYFSRVSFPVPGTGTLRVRRKYIPGPSLSNGDGEYSGGRLSFIDRDVSGTINQRLEVSPCSSMKFHQLVCKAIRDDREIAVLILMEFERGERGDGEERGKREKESRDAGLLKKVLRCKQNLLHFSN